MSDDSDNRVMWPFAPDWSKSYTISYEFKTDIFTSEDGSEQRRALRSTPRKSLSFSVLVAFGALRSFNRLVDTAQNLSIIMPEVTRFVTATANAAAGALTVAVSSVPYWMMREGAEVILNTPAGYRLAVVDDFTEFTVTFKAGVDALSAGALIYPALTGMLGAQLSAKRVTNSVAQVQVEFAVDPASEVYPTTLPDLLYGGFEIVTLNPNWASGADVSHQWAVETVDMGRGRTTVYRPIDFPTAVRSYQVVAASSEALVGLFVRMRGQRGTFYLSSMEPDLVPAGSTIAGTTVTVEGSDTYYAYRNDPVRKAIEIYAPGVGRWMSSVVDFAISGGNTVITIADPLPSIPVASVARISWLTFARFATDQLQIAFAASAAFTATLNVKTLPPVTTDYLALRASVDGAIRETPAGDDRAVIYL